jgi:release factor glutamine methyltransferase
MTESQSERAPYLSSEDSTLLRKALVGRTGEMALELGAGNGGNLLAMASGFRVVVGTDVTRPGMDDWKGAGVDYVLCDLAACLRDGAFDLVAFNPPYLPSDVIVDAAVDAGGGMGAPKRFLEEALRVVKKSGAVLWLLNDEAEVEEFEEICSRSGFKMKRVAEERMFYESLYVFEAIQDSD